MVQVLPYVPGVGEQLAPYIAQAGASLGDAMVKKRARTALEQLLTPQAGANTAGSPVNKFNQVAQQGNQGSNLRPFELLQVQNLAEKAYGPEGARVLTSSLLEQQKLAEKEASQMRLKDYDRRSALIQKDVEQNLGRRESIRKEREDLKVGLNAIESGEVGGFDINWLADRFGPAGEPLKNVKGIQLESAMKNLLVDSLQKTAGRPNQWIEQQIKSATPSIGKTKEANETLFATALAKLDVEEKVLDAKDELLSQYEQAGVSPPANLDKLVHDIVKPYAQQVEDRLAYDLRVIYEKSKGETYLNNLKKVPQGTPLTLQKRDALLEKYKGDKQKAKEMAERLGYTIPSPSVVMRDNQEQESNADQ